MVKCVDYDGEDSYLWQLPYYLIPDYTVGAMVFAPSIGSGLPGKPTSKASGTIAKAAGTGSPASVGPALIGGIANKLLDVMLVQFMLRTVGKLQIADKATNAAFSKVTVTGNINEPATLPALTALAGLAQQKQTVIGPGKTQTLQTMLLNSLVKKALPGSYPYIYIWQDCPVILADAIEAACKSNPKVWTSPYV